MLQLPVDSCCSQAKLSADPFLHGTRPDRPSRCALPCHILSCDIQMSTCLSQAAKLVCLSSAYMHGCAADEPAAPTQAAAGRSTTYCQLHSSARTPEAGGDDSGSLTKCFHGSLHVPIRIFQVELGCGLINVQAAPKHLAQTRLQHINLHTTQHTEPRLPPAPAHETQAANQQCTDISDGTLMPNIADLSVQTLLIACTCVAAA